MKKLRLKSWVKVVLVIMILVILGVAVKKIDDDFIDSCTEAGYSKDYCIREK